MPEPSAGGVRQSRHAQHPAQGGAQDLVLGDVDGELVVGDLDRHHQPGTAGDLVADPDPPADRAQGFLDGAVALQNAAASRAGQPDQGLGQAPATGRRRGRPRPSSRKPGSRA